MDSDCGGGKTVSFRQYRSGFIECSMYCARLEQSRSTQVRGFIIFNDDGRVPTNVKRK